jgi:hypothetical protein
MAGCQKLFVTLMDITPNNRVACQEVLALLDIRPSKEGGEMLLGELFQGPHCEVLSAVSGRAQEVCLAQATQQDRKARDDEVLQ